MATITTTTSLSFDAAASLTVGVDKNFEGRIAFTSANDDVWPSFTVTKPQSKTYGPFGIAMTVVITVGNGSLDYTINGGMGGFGYDTDGNVTGLVSGDGTAVKTGFDTVVNLRDWSGFDNTGTNSMRTTMQAAVDELETFGKGRIELERGTYAMDGSLTIRGGNPTLNGGYQGGIELVGQHMVDTVLSFSTGGIIIDCGPAPTHGSNSALAMLRLAQLKVLGPGKATSGSVGLDVSPQGVYQSTPNAVHLDRVWFDGFENHARFDDTTSLWITWCYFINYVKALRFGYNHDTMSVFWNRFGDNQVAIGSQTEIAMAWDFVSPRHGSGGVAGTVGVAPNAAATLTGAQNHAIKHNWLVRQALVADIADPSASNITFEHNQFESCMHYAKIGNTNTTTAPTRIEFKQNTFMRTDGEEQTQAMFLFPNTGSGGSLALIRNVCDTATGPKMGWVQCGTGSTIEFDNNSLTVSGGYVTEANHLIVGASGKKIVLSSGAKYSFGGPGSTGGTIERQGNFSGRDNTPDVAHWAYNASASASIYHRWQAKGLGSDTVSGNAYDIKSLTVNGTRFATANGFVQPLAASSTPSLGSDGAVARAGLFFKSGGAGVADELYCCMKSAADTYSWKLVATG